MSDLDGFVQELYEKRPWFDFRRKKLKLQALRSISAQGNPFVISSIFRFVFSWDREISQETAHTIHELMSKVKSSQWTQLYPSFKYIDHYNMQLRFLTRFPEPVAVHLIGIASLNCNGRVRQKAIRKLQEFISPKKIPYIMLRLGDWVPQVRETAESAIAECLKPEYAEAFMSYTYILDWMIRVERVDLSRIHNQISEYLTSSCSEEYLKLVLDNPDRRVRLFGYKILLDKAPCDAEILEKGAKDKNPRIRQFIFQSICNLPVDNISRHLPIFLQDPSPAIKSSAMMAVSENMWQEFRSIIFDNIFSSSPSIRNTARFLLKSHGFKAFANEYRRRIESEQISPGILSGLAETGNKEDFVILKKYINHLQSKNRLAAITGLYRLDAERSIHYLINALHDPVQRVRRISSKILCKYRNFDRNAVRTVLRHGTAASKKSALKVLCDSASWDVLEDILQMTTDGDEAVRMAAWDNLSKWFLKRSAKNWMKPSQAALISLEAKIKELNSKPIEIPDLAKRAWKELPDLIESGKHIWKY